MRDPLLRRLAAPTGAGGEVDGAESVLVRGVCGSHPSKTAEGGGACRVAVNLGIPNPFKKANPVRRSHLRPKRPRIRGQTTLVSSRPGTVTHTKRIHRRQRLIVCFPFQIPMTMSGQALRTPSINRPMEKY